MSIHMSQRRPAVYLDYSASTPLHPAAAEAMRPFWESQFGNSSSAHAQGRAAEAAVEDSRDRIAALLNCHPSEIVFTSGGTESDNLALRGASIGQRAKTCARRIVTSRAEHSAVSKTAADLAEWHNFEAVFAPVNAFGQVDEAALVPLLPGAALVSLMTANNEIGSLHDVERLAALAHRHGALFHTDAVQAGGQLPLDVRALGIDMLSLSAHKFYGPKGVGLLYVRNGTPLVPSQTGGSHEQGRRAGTSNTPGIVGMAAALELAVCEMDTRAAHLRVLRDGLITGILARVPGAFLTGDPVVRLPGHASFVFEGVDGNLLLMHLDSRGVMASSGSACKTGSPEPSEVLLAMGYSRELALSGLRLTVGPGTTEAEIDYAIAAVAESVVAVRKLGVQYA